MDSWRIALTTANHMPLITVNTLLFGVLYQLYLADFDKRSFVFTLLFRPHVLCFKSAARAVESHLRKSLLCFLFPFNVSSSKTGRN